MSDSDVLFLILAAIYLSECILWVPREAAAFLAPFGRRAHLRRPSFTLGWSGTGPLLRNPLPPLGFAALCAFGSGGARAATAPAAAAPGSRLDAEAVAARVEEYRSRSGALRVLCNLLFLSMFVLAPALVRWQGLGRWWMPLLAALVLLMAATLFAYRRAHGALYPGQSAERRKRIAALLFSPPAVARAHDALARDLLAPFHPLAAAAALSPREEFLDLARRALVDARAAAPGAAAGDASAAAGRGGARAGKPAAPGPSVGEIEALVRRAGARPEELLAPPARPEAHARSYCPRCHCQYTFAAGACADCGGLGLQPL